MCASAKNQIFKESLPLPAPTFFINISCKHEHTQISTMKIVFIYSVYTLNNQKVSARIFFN